MREFTGDYYRCDFCEHVWDFMDSHCPECGKQDFDTMNANEVRFISSAYPKEEENRLLVMLKNHDD